MPSLFSPEFWSSVWETHKANPAVFAPLLTFASSLLTVLVALGAAWITLRRHFAQLEADTQRRITDSFAKAVEQLGDTIRAPSPSLRRR